MAASLLDSLMQQLESRGAIDQIAGKLGVEPAKANSAVSAGIPAILAGLAKNAKDLCWFTTLVTLPCVVRC